MGSGSLCAAGVQPPGSRLRHFDCADDCGVACSPTGRRRRDQDTPQKAAGVASDQQAGFWARSSGVPLGDDAASAIAAFRAEVKDPIGIGDQVEVMFQHDHRVAGINQSLEDSTRRCTSAMCKRWWVPRG